MKWPLAENNGRARRSARLLTDGDVPEENCLTFLFSCVWVARSNANHLPGEQARPIPVINWTLFSAEGWQVSSYLAGKDPVITICVNRCEDSQTN